MESRQNNILLSIFLICTFIADMVFYVGSTWYFDAGYKMNVPNASIGNAFYLIAVISLLLIAFTNYPSNIPYNRLSQILILGMVIPGIIWIIRTVIIDDENIITLMIRQYSPYLLLFSVAMIIGRREEMYQKVIAFFEKIYFLYFIIAIFYQIQLMILYGVGQRPKSCAIYQYLIEGITIWLLLAFNRDDYRKQRNAKIGLVLLTICGLITLSRSYISTVIICWYLHICFATERRARNINIKFTIFFAALIILVNFIAPSMLDVFMERLFTDSRSSQYAEFFSQVSLAQILFGQGINATYSFSRFESYAYFDNCYIVMIFRYGILGVACQLLLFVYSLYVAYRKKMRENWQLILIWFAMTNGLSVYLPYQYTFSIVAVWISMGRILKKENSIRGYDYE